MSEKDTIPQNRTVFFVLSLLYPYRNSRTFEDCAHDCVRCIHVFTGKKTSTPNNLRKSFLSCYHSTSRSFLCIIPTLSLSTAPCTSQGPWLINSSFAFVTNSLWKKKKIGPVITNVIHVIASQLYSAAPSCDYFSQHGEWYLLLAITFSKSPNWLPVQSSNRIWSIYVISRLLFT